MQKPKLELSWTNKDKSLFYDLNKKEYIWVDKKDPRVSEPRILLEKKSYGDKNSENLLIKGDNLLALKAIEVDFGKKIKCIYIDPPYNTGSAFEHYEDGLAHSIWLTMMRDRLRILRNLLRDDGFIFVQIDDNEMGYLKVLMDEVFGRENFINTIVWKRRGGAANPSNRLNNVTDYILWYSKTSHYSINHQTSMEDDNTKEYIRERFVHDFEGRKYMPAPIERNEKLGMRETMRYEHKGYKPKWGWMVSKERLEELDATGRLHWNTKGRPVRRVFLDEYKGQPIANLWTDIKVINPMSKERLNFDGQKPEAVIHRILTLSTEEGDWVLDSFLGTGSTVATAHKMKRKWIGIELGEQAETYAFPRLKRITDGKDEGGITKLVNWKGGGGFKYLELGESLFVEDEELRLTVLNPKVYNGALIRAVLKVEGFKLLHPDNGLHGIAGRTIAHVTEQYLNQRYVDVLVREVADSADLIVIYAKTISSKIIQPENVEIRRIPKVLLGKFKV